MAPAAASRQQASISWLPAGLRGGWRGAGPSGHQTTCTGLDQPESQMPGTLEGALGRVGDATRHSEGPLRLVLSEGEVERLLIIKLS